MVSGSTPSIFIPAELPFLSQTTPMISRELAYNKFTEEENLRLGLWIILQDRMRPHRSDG